jgi:thiol-disulfide isomerase/thioredoxin
MSLLEFYGAECPHCLAMMPIVERLKKEGFAVEQFETWHDAENAKKLKEYDKGFCGGVPFFINTESGKWICGSESYERLRAWAEGK